MIELILAYLGTGVAAHIVAWVYYAINVKDTSYLEVYKTFHKSIFTFVKSMLLWPFVIRIAMHPQFIKAVEEISDNLEKTQATKFTPVPGVRDNRIWISIHSPIGLVWIRFTPYNSSFLATHIILSQHDQPFAVGRLGLTYDQLIALPNWYPFSFISEDSLDGLEAISLADSDKEWLELCVEGREKARAEYVTQKKSEWLK